MKPSVVLYKGEYCLWYRNNPSGFAQLLNSNGVKMIGTPSPDKLTITKELICKQFNGNGYCRTKQGVFSLTSGIKITHPGILKLFP